MLFRMNHEHECERSQKLSAWLDRELDAESSRELESVLHRDPELQEQAAELRALDKALAQWPAPPVSPDLRPAVLSRVRKDMTAGVWQRMRSVWSDLVQTAGWAAAGVTVGLILLTAWNGPQRIPAESSEEMAIAMMMPQNIVATADNTSQEENE